MAGSASVFTTTLTQDAFFENSVDVIVEVLRSYESDHPKNLGLVQQMIPAIMSLQPRFQAALSSGDDDAIRAYCRIFTEMGESYMSLLMDPQDLNQIALVKLVLQCAAIADKEVACITMNFWYRFVYCLENIPDMRFRQVKVDYFQPLLIELIDICCALMEFPEEVNGGVDANTMDELLKNRSYVADTIEDCCRLLGEAAILVQIGTRIQKVVTAQQALPPPQVAALWHPIESCLFATKSIAKFIPKSEETMMPHVMSLVQHQYAASTSLHFLFRNTINGLIGHYAAWLKAHPAFLEPFFAFVLFGFNSPLTSESSATAVKLLCESCGVLMSDPVMRLYEQVVSAPGSVELRDELLILEGLCQVISRQDFDVAGSTLSRVMQPIGSHLEAALANPGSSCKEVNGQLDRLVVLVSKVKSAGPVLASQPNLVVSLVTQCWPFFEQILQRYGAESTTSEKMSRLYKYALRSTKHEFAPLLDRLMQQLVLVFEASFKSSYLYCASICVTEFSNKPAEYGAKLHILISSLSQSVFKRFQTLDGFTSNPDVVEEFFYLLSRVISYCPSILFQSELLGEALRCSVVGLQVHHREANKGVLNFLEGVATHSMSASISPADKAGMEQAISMNGESIVTGICVSLMGDAPLFYLDCGKGSLAGVLFKLCQLCPQFASAWVTSGAAVGAQKGGVPEQIGRDFVGAVGQTLGNREEFGNMFRHFHEACWRARRQAAGGGR
jgi:transportin-3